MKSLVKYFSTIFILLMCFYSCGSKDKNVSNENILTSKSWKRGMTDRNSSTNPTSNSQEILYAAIPSCQQDDVLQFNSDGKLVINNGSDKCSTDEQATQTVNYSYDKTNNELTIDGVKYKVAEMTSSQIKYYAELSSQTGYSYIVYLLQ